MLIQRKEGRSKAASRTRLLAAGMLSVVLIGTGGCAKQVDDVGTETVKPDTAVPPEDGKSDASGAPQFAEAGEGIPIQLGVDANLFDYRRTIRNEATNASVVIDGYVSTLTSQSASVVDVRAFQTQQKQREQLAKAFFGNEVLEYGAGCMEKDVLDQRLEKVDDRLRQVDTVLTGEQQMREGTEVVTAGPEGLLQEAVLYEDIRAILEEEKEDYQRAAETAVRTPARAEDFSGDDFCGTMDGREYRLSFRRSVPEFAEASLLATYGAEALARYYGQENPEQVVVLEMRDGLGAHAPEAIKKAAKFSLVNEEEGVSQSGFGVTDTRIAQAGKNLCPMTEEEAAAQVQALLDRIGLTGLEVSIANPMIWTSGTEGEAPAYVADGYQLVLRPMAGADRLIDDRADEFDRYLRITDEDRAKSMPGNGKVTAYVNGEGILRLTVENMIVSRSATEGVSLLTFESIMGIAADRFQQWLEGRTEEDSVRISVVEQRYYRIEGENPDSFTYIPAWFFRASQPSPEAYLILNAMDGSVLMERQD